MVISNGPLQIVFSYNVLKDLSHWMKICCHWKTQIVIALNLRKFLDNADVVTKSNYVSTKLSIFIIKYCKNIQYIDLHKVQYIANTFNTLPSLIYLVKNLQHLQSVYFPYICINHIYKTSNLITALPPTLKCLSFLTELDTNTFRQIGKHLGGSLEELQVPLTQMNNDSRKLLGLIIDEMLLNLCNLKRLLLIYTHDNKNHFIHRIHCINVHSSLELSNWSTIISLKLTHLNLGFNPISFGDVVNLSVRCKSLKELTIHTSFPYHHLEKIVMLLSNQHVFVQLTVLNIFYCNRWLMTNLMDSLQLVKPNMKIITYRCIS